MCWGLSRRPISWGGRSGGSIFGRWGRETWGDERFSFHRENGRDRDAFDRSGEGVDRGGTGPDLLRGGPLASPRGSGGGGGSQLVFLGQFSGGERRGHVGRSFYRALAGAHGDRASGFCFGVWSIPPRVCRIDPRGRDFAFGRFFLGESPVAGSVGVDPERVRYRSPHSQHSASSAWEEPPLFNSSKKGHSV
jgi:hypothetical protein